MFSCGELIQRLEVWIEHGWIRQIDRVFLQFLQRLDPKAEPLFLLAGLLTSAQLKQGHVCLDLTSAVLEGLKQTIFSGEEENWLNIPIDIWLDAIRKSRLVSEGNGATPLVLSGNQLYLRRYWTYEQQVAADIRSRLGFRALSTEEVSAEKIKETLDKLFSTNKGIHWQKIACAVAARSTFSIITGGPGTGKTTTIVRFLSLFQSIYPHKKIRLAASTGKAAARLTEAIQKVNPNTKTFLSATTIHRLLGTQSDTKHFRNDANNPLHADLVVVDEASMIDLEIMVALLAALRSDTQLVLVGDKDQLASVEAGTVLADLCKEPGFYSPEIANWIYKATGEKVPEGKSGVLAQHVVSLQTRYRFSEGIGKLADAVHSGEIVKVKQVVENEPPYQDVHKVVETSNAKELYASEDRGYNHYLKVINDQRPLLESNSLLYDEWATNVLRAFSQFQILCALREGPWGVAGLNRQVLETLHGKSFQISDWYEGRPVLMIQNDYSLNLMNGDVGITLQRKEGLRVAFRLPDGSIRWVSTIRLPEIETAYAMTVHKSQGSEFSDVLLVLPEQDNPVLTRELIYTGITRAKEQLYMFLPNLKILENSIMRRVQRSGNLLTALQSDLIGYR